MINTTTRTTKIVQELRKKHKLDEHRPEPTTDGDGKIVPPPLEDVIAYRKRREAYVAEFRQRVHENFRETLKDQMAEAVKRKAAMAEAAKKRRKRDGDTG